jgi:CelD/BcsL family acetyltransferase involved in cellulose biosynthesis
MQDKATISVNLVEGDDARALLQCDRFGRDWDALHQACSWRTVAQRRDFVRAWYDCYASRCRPVLLTADSGGRCVGVLPLALPVGSRRLVFAGWPQAEYYGWLCEDRFLSEFLGDGLDALARRFPGSGLSFCYLPAGAPAEALLAHPRWGKQCRTFTARRPLIDAQDSDAIKKLWKGRRNELNRLKRLGEVTLERLTTPEQLAAVFDELIAYYDFRIGALRGRPAFKTDPCKRDFYLTLMRSADLLQASVLRAGSMLAAANLGFRNYDGVALGVFCYSPLLSKCSPGMIFLLMEAEQLARQGSGLLDLTPEGEWKHDIATRHDEVRRIDVFFRRASLLAYDARKQLKRAAQGAATSLGLTKSRLASVQQRVLSSRAGRSLRSFFAREATAPASESARVYVVAPEALKDSASTPPVVRDQVNDLLTLYPQAPPGALQQFLSQSLRQLERGNHVYTVRVDNRLTYSAWRCENQQKIKLPELDQEISLPPNAVVLFGCDHHGASQPMPFYEACIRQMLVDARPMSDTHTYCVVVRDDDRLTQDAVERLGGVLKSSLNSRSQSLALGS